ncbi:MAG: 30S ribosomal protein S9 [Candidatus Nealsonbacteria bacterium]|nr:30S ribosomal protein S9 [Candidatus Nealsonbacteria bacterium]
MPKATKTIKKTLPPKESPKSTEKYFEAIGRRKTSSARVRIFLNDSKEILVNDKPYDVYFPTLDMQEKVVSPLNSIGTDKFKILVKVSGGGIHSQSEAVRHGIARALILFNLDFRKRLKKAGFLTRDSRMRERKKFGLKRARRAPQWRKR